MTYYKGFYIDPKESHITGLFPIYLNRDGKGKVIGKADSIGMAQDYIDIWLERNKVGADSIRTLDRIREAGR